MYRFHHVAYAALGLLLGAGLARADDCNSNGVDDLLDIASATSADCNSDGVPDECDLVAPGASAVSTDTQDLVTGIALTPPAGTGENDLLIAAISSDTADPLTAPAGWNRLVSRLVPADRGRFEVYTRVATASEPADYTWTWSDNQAVAGGILRYEGIDPAEPIVALATISSFGGAAEAPNLEVLIDKTVIVRLVGVEDAGSPPEYPVDHTGQFSLTSSQSATGAQRAAAADRFQALAGQTGAAVFEFSGGERFIGTTLALKPDLPRDCNTNGIPDSCDIASGTSNDCNSNAIPDECEQDCNENGTPDDCDVVAGTSSDIDDDIIPDECQIIYVNALADPGGDGRSWATALQHLYDASQALFLDDTLRQVWVAAGSYRLAPDSNSEANLSVQDGIRFFGGFAGTESSLAQRNLSAHPTIITGDLFSNDGPGFANFGENSLNLVNLQGGLIDGFFLTEASDGAVVCFESGTISNCTIMANLTNGNGAGFRFSTYEVPILVNCVFVGNHATQNGGAIYSDISDNIDITNCTIYGNSAGGTCGGIYLAAPCETGPRLRNCIIRDNSDATGVNLAAQIVLGPTGCDAGPVTLGGSRVISENFLQFASGTLALGNDTRDPILVDPDGMDNVLGTIDDQLDLDTISPAIEVGDTTSLPPDPADLNNNLDLFENIPVDRAGMPRTVGCFVDAGALEFQFDPILKGDSDQDCDIDLTDYNFLNSCLDFSGPDVPTAPFCLTLFDFDVDFDLDLADFAAFSRAFNTTP